MFLINNEAHIALNNENHEGNAGISIRVRISVGINGFHR